MSKKSDKYRDQEAQDNQEVVTPPELVAHIYNFLDEDDFIGKDVLEPCVGPGALLQPMLDDIEDGGDGLGIKSLTVMDIQPIHVEDFILNLKAAKEKGLIKN